MLFSVIIPTYNRKNLLKKAINSIINQSINNWELIIIDNFSNDGTEDMVNSFDNPKISFHKLLRTGLVSKSVNLGIKKAKGEWICFLDSDDTYYPDKLKICKNIIDNNDIDLIFHDLCIVYKNKKFLRKIIKGNFFKDSVLKEILIYGCSIGESSVIVKKDRLLDVNLVSEDISLSQTYDLDLWLKLSTITNKFYYIPQVLGSYLIHDDNFQEKNVDISVKEFLTMSPFLNNLTLSEKKKFDGRLAYKSSRFFYNNSHYNKSLQKAICALKKGTIKIKFLSSITIIQNYIKKLFFFKNK